MVFKVSAASCAAALLLESARLQLVRLAVSCFIGALPFLAALLKKESLAPVLPLKMASAMTVPPNGTLVAAEGPEGGVP
jgi:hypothetical protein